MTTRRLSTMQTELVAGAIAVLALSALAVGVWTTGSQASDPDDPASAQIPDLEFPSEAGKILAADVVFTADGVTASEGEVHRGGAPAREGVPEFLQVDQEDDEGAVLGSFHEWDPRHVRQYDGDGHFHEEREDGELSLITPFEPDLAEVVVRDADTGEELVRIDATGPAADYCQDNPDDEDCHTDLAIDAEADPDPAVAGEELDYTVVVDNLGPNPAHDVVVTVDLDEAVSYEQGIDGCTELDGNVECDLGRIPGGNDEEIEIVVAIDPALVHEAGAPTTITSGFDVADEAGHDPNLGNNSAEVETLVEAEADLEMAEVTASPPQEQVIGESDEVDVDARIANHGPSTPMDVTTTWEAEADDGITVTPTNAEDDTAALELGEPETVGRTFTVVCDAPGVHEVTITAVVSPTNEDDRDPDLDNNADTVAFEIDCVVPITINVKPGEEPNAINSRRSVGDVPVALLTTDAGEYGNPLAFDATTVDVTSTRAGARDAVDAGRGATPAHDGHEEDSWEPDNETRDGDTDLLIHFETPSDTELGQEDDELCVRGEYIEPSTGSSFRFVGCDDVSVVR